MRDLLSATTMSLAKRSRTIHGGLGTNTLQAFGPVEKEIWHHQIPEVHPCEELQKWKAERFSSRGKRIIIKAIFQLERYRSSEPEVLA